MNSVEIGKKLTALRGDKTQAEVSRDLGISDSALSAYENGDRIPRDEIKIRIADYYGESVSNIFFASK